jgi:dTDP-4-amino-4,6-dideoxygalactose transaminase
MPAFADVDKDTWQLTPEIARRVAGKMPIHAVMPVAVYGVPVSADDWDKFTEDTGIPVIIDAAAALETQAVPGKCLLAHSLHATKPFSVGEGGILISRRRDQIDEARCISNFGTIMRIAQKDGSNAKMSELHAAVGLAQLDRWAGIKKRRADVFARYRAALAKSGLDLALQKGIEKAIVSALMLKVSGASAAGIVDNLNARSIAAHRMYLPPLYHHPYFSKCVVVDGQGKQLPGTASLEQRIALMENSEMLNQSLFGVPFHAFVGEDDIAHVMHTLAQALDKPHGQSARGR